MASEHEVVSITGASTGCGLQLLLFLGPRRPTKLAVRHVASAEQAWDLACVVLLGQLRGRLLALDAHNDAPWEAARFCAWLAPAGEDVRLERHG